MNSCSGEPVVLSSTSPLGEAGAFVGAALGALVSSSALGSGVGAAVGTRISALEQPSQEELENNQEEQSAASTELSQECSEEKQKEDHTSAVNESSLETHQKQGGASTSNPASPQGSSTSSCLEKVGESFTGTEAEVVEEVGQRRGKRPWYKRKKRWLQIVIVVLILGGLGAGAWFLAPLVIKRVAIPALSWIQHTFSRIELAFLIIAILTVGQACFFPGGVLIWLAGIVFGYGWGFLIVMLGTSLGAAFAFGLGRRFLKQRFQVWLLKHRKVQLVVSYAERGDWRVRTQTVFLLRYSPIPYTLICYGLAATRLPFGPYLLGTALQQIPDTFAGLYTGIALQDLSDYLSGKQVPSAVQIVTNVLGLVCTLLIVVGATIYCRRLLRQLEKQEADQTGQRA